MTITITAEEGRNNLARFELTRVILVEGSDDQAVIAGLIRSESLDEFHIHNMIGKDKWTGKLKAICRVPGFGKVTAVGLVRDADKDGGATWQSCMGSLSAARLPTPGTPDLLEPGRPSIAVSIVPSRSDMGAIEEVCIPAFDQRQMACVNGYFSCVDPSAIPSSKAAVQAYLAGLQPVCKDLSVAIRNGLLDFSHQSFDGLRTFLHELDSA